MHARCAPGKAAQSARAGDDDRERRTGRSGGGDHIRSYSGPSRSHSFLCVLFVSSRCSVKAPYSSFSGYAHLSAGLSCGLSGLGAGLAIGIVGDAGVRANGIQPKLFVPMVLILIFAEALGLYGLIVGIILSQQTQTCKLPDF